MAIVLLSGGLDSAVALAMTRRPRLALTFDYGQRAARPEIRAAAALARRYGVAHRAIALPWLRGDNALQRRRALPKPRLDDAARCRETAKAVWVPNRNGVFIAVAAALAEAAGIRDVVTGFNREEAATFPDNSRDFMRATNRALAFSTASGVRVVSPTSGMTKRQIVARARKLGVPLRLCWPCYEGGRRLCGRCESCARFLRAVA